MTKIGRPSLLDTPEGVEAFAHALTLGLTNKELGEQFAVTDRTIKNWKRDPRVRAAALKHIEDRIRRIASKVDAEMENRLAKLGGLSIKEILMVRKEYLGGVLRLQAEGGRADSATINEAMTEIEENPDLAIELRELLEKHAAQE